MFSFDRQVFGLGNKTYEHYNAMGKYVDKRLAELGATRVFELGMGDDDANMEDDFITWKDAMWPKVKMVDLYEYFSCDLDIWFDTIFIPYLVFIVIKLLSYLFLFFHLCVCVLSHVRLI